VPREDEINEMKEKVHPSALFTSHGSHGLWLWDFMGNIFKTLRHSSGCMKATWKMGYSPAHCINPGTP
jgi:hypothetical protein